MRLKSPEAIGITFSLMDKGDVFSLKMGISDIFPISRIKKQVKSTSMLEESFQGRKKNKEIKEIKKRNSH